MSIKTWRERCDEHPDHNGIVTNRMIQERMQEEIDELRQAIEQAEQAQPVAWRTFDGEGGYDFRTYDSNEGYAQEWAKRNPRHVGWVDALYTAPPQRKPLTDAEIEALWQGTSPYYDHQDFARAIEAAHGIKGEV